MFVSPTEPPVFVDTLDWITSSVPENYGADFLWNSPLGLVGVQRKEFPGDFLASVQDGRLGGEAFGKMAQLQVAVLLLEGRDRWTTEGYLMSSGKYHQSWTRTQHRNFLASTQLRGVHVQWSDDKFDTVSFLRDLYAWSQKPRHAATTHRITPEGSWGHVSNRDFQVHVLSSLPGISIVLASAMIDTLGFPLGLRVTREQLMTVPGIAAGRADKIIKTFEKVREAKE